VDHLLLSSGLCLDQGFLDGYELGSVVCLALSWIKSCGAILELSIGVVDSPSGSGCGLTIVSGCAISEYE